MILSSAISGILTSFLRDLYSFHKHFWCFSLLLLHSDRFPCFQTFIINRENLKKIGRAGDNASKRETPDQIREGWNLCERQITKLNEELVKWRLGEPLANKRFLLFISFYISGISHFAKYRFSIRKVQILISQSTDFSIRKVQILNSQSTDFSIRKVQIFQFAKYRFLNSQSADSQSTNSQSTISLVFRKKNTLTTVNEIDKCQSITVNCSDK